jgi:hypothetical protein
LNGDIFVVECIVELQQKFAKPYKCSPQSLWLMLTYFFSIGSTPHWPFLFGHQFVGGMPY